MDAYVLETLLTRGWRRGGEVYWTISQAERVGKALLKRKAAQGVRVLPVQVELEPVLELLQKAVAAGTGEARRE